MPRYYLRVEGVNMEGFVYDTNDLSTIRGGSLLLLGIPDRAEQAFKKTPAQKVENITKGASWGLFVFEAISDNEAAEIAREVKNSVGQGALRHATVVVDVCPATRGAFVEDLQRLTALNRWRQMQSPSVAVPDQKESKKDQTIDGACALDFFRPAAHPDTKGRDKITVSTSVHERRRIGREKKNRDWYVEKTGLNDLPDFAHDFHELAEGSRKTYGNLCRKMAVIYLDGNHFGRLRDRLCTDAESQSRFDETLRRYQDGALKTLLQKSYRDEHWLFKEEDAGPSKLIRLQTLLWGGDEFIWVVPAWQGWWILAEFFRISNQWSIEGHRLTHAAGLVFCHHKAPIHRIKQVAMQLADAAKAKSRRENLVGYQVLESFDHVGGNLQAVREQRLPAMVDAHELIIDGDAMHLVVEPMVQQVKEKLAKRRLYRIVESLDDRHGRTDALIEAACGACGLATDDIHKLGLCFGSGYGLWLHLLELWDYITLFNDGGSHATH